MKHFMDDYEMNLKLSYLAQEYDKRRKKLLE